MDKERKKIIEYFEKRYLKGTCWDSLNDLLDDRTDFQVNIIRVLTAVELKGVWRGLNDCNKIWNLPKKRYW